MAIWKECIGRLTEEARQSIDHRELIVTLFLNGSKRTRRLGPALLSIQLPLSVGYNSDAIVSVNVNASATTAENTVENMGTFRCQRKKGALGKGLGKTTGWIHRTSLKKHGKDEITAPSPSVMHH